MKKLLVLSLALSAIIFTATAQQKREMKEGKDGIHKGHHKKAMMVKDMNFSDAQKAQMKANREEFKNKMQELNKNESLTVKEQRDRKEALHNEQKAKMQALLTPEQKTKIAASKAKMEANRKEMGEKRMEMLKTKLGLSSDQFSKWKAQNEATHTQLKAIKENQLLSSDAKREKMKAVKVAAKEQRKSIFTADQLKKMEELKKDYRNKDWKQSKK